MNNRMLGTERPAPKKRTASSRQIGRLRGSSSRRNRRAIAAIAVVVVLVAVLFGIYQASKPASTATGSGYPHTAGQPGIGAVAPAFTLPSSTGGNISLADFRGQTVLLYFQEGLSCQPCWDQITDLQKNEAALTAAGVQHVVSITTDPTDLVTRKTSDMHLTIPVLSDTDLAISRDYRATDYGMMGDSRDGHSFILVGPDGRIQWRADYGGAPAYTMYLPTDKLLTDLRAEERQP